MRIFFNGGQAWSAIVEYKVILCLLAAVIVAYAEEKEDKVNAAVGEFYTFYICMDMFSLSNPGFHLH